MLSCFPLILSQIHLARVRFGIKINIRNILVDKKKKKKTKKISNNKKKKKKKHYIKKKKKKNARTISNNDKVYRTHIKIEILKSTLSSKIF